MTRSNLARAAAQVLATAIGAYVAALAGKIHPVPEDWNTQAEYPALAIVPGRAQLLNWPDQEVDDTVDGQLVVEAGTFEARFTLRLLAPVAAVREDLEQQVLEAFFQDPDRPGVILGSVSGVQLTRPSDMTVVGTTYQAPVAFALDDNEWQDELVFSAKRESQLEVAVQYPLLVMRAPVSTMNEVLVAITHDLNTTRPSPLDETVEVNQDGSITKVTV